MVLTEKRVCVNIVENPLPVWVLKECRFVNERIRPTVHLTQTNHKDREMTTRSHKTAT